MFITAVDTYIREQYAANLNGARTQPRGLMEEPLKAGQTTTGGGSDM